jgi:hypothetical protein
VRQLFTRTALILTMALGSVVTIAGAASATTTTTTPTKTVPTTTPTKTVPSTTVPLAIQAAYKKWEVHYGAYLLGLSSDYSSTFATSSQSPVPIPTLIKNCGQLKVDATNASHFPKVPVSSIEKVVKKMIEASVDLSFTCQQALKSKFKSEKPRVAFYYLENLAESPIYTALSDMSREYPLPHGTLPKHVKRK